MSESSTLKQRQLELAPLFSNHDNINVASNPGISEAASKDDVVAGEGKKNWWYQWREKTEEIWRDTCPVEETNYFTRRKLELSELLSAEILSVSNPLLSTTSLAYVKDDSYMKYTTDSEEYAKGIGLKKVDNREDWLKTLSLIETKPVDVKLRVIPYVLKPKLSDEVKLMVIEKLESDSRLSKWRKYAGKDTYQLANEWPMKDFREFSSAVKELYSKIKQHVESELRVQETVVDMAFSYVKKKVEDVANFKVKDLVQLEDRLFSLCNDKDSFDQNTITVEFRKRKLHGWCSYIAKIVDPKGSDSYLRSLVGELKQNTEEQKASFVSSKEAASRFASYVSCRTPEANDIVTYKSKQPGRKTGKEDKDWQSWKSYGYAKKYDPKSASRNCEKSYEKKKDDSGGTKTQKESWGKSRNESEHQTRYGRTVKKPQRYDPGEGEAKKATSQQIEPMKNLVVANSEEEFSNKFDRGRRVPVLLDSGSTKSLVSVSLVDKVFPSDYNAVVGFGNHETKVEGKAKMLVEPLEGREPVEVEALCIEDTSFVSNAKVVIGVEDIPSFRDPSL